MIAQSPLADEFTAEYSVFVASSERTTLSLPLFASIEDARLGGIRPVLLTSANARISWFVAEALRRAGGHWAVHDDERRVHDALSGYRIGAFRDLWTDSSTERERLDGYATPSPHAQGAFIVEVFARAHAVPETRIGLLAERLVAELGLGHLERWGLTEPLTRRWHPEQFTESLRRGMPTSGPHYAASADGALVRTVVSRTRAGLLEHTRVLAPVGDYHAPTGLEPGAALGAHPAVTGALRMLVHEFTPTVALVSYAEVDDLAHGSGQRAAARRRDQPVAVLIGPRAVRDLRLDLDELGTRHDIEQLGPGRVPSALVRLSGRDELWHQLVAFGHDLDPERVAAAMGFDREGAR